MKSTLCLLFGGPYFAYRHWNVEPYFACRHWNVGPYFACRHWNVGPQKTLIFFIKLSFRFDRLIESLTFALPRMSIDIFPGANPTIASYNASVVKIYSAVNSMVRF
jgi:hypothetical protein